PRLERRYFRVPHFPKFRARTPHRRVEIRCCREILLHDETFSARHFIIVGGRFHTMNFHDVHTLEERLLLMRQLAERFNQRAELIDREGSFPFDNIEELKQAGYTSLTVPRSHGGQEISLYEMVRLQEMLATGDGS